MLREGSESGHARANVDESRIVSTNKRGLEALSCSDGIEQSPKRRASSSPPQPHATRSDNARASVGSQLARGTAGPSHVHGLRSVPSALRLSSLGDVVRLITGTGWVPPGIWRCN